MCGISGFVKETSNDDIELLRKLNNLIIHRGPDSEGFFCDSVEGQSIGLAMRRLSIVDIDGGSQPIFDSSNDVIIVFNGEIYNYLYLRDYCISLGYTFSTKTDTEVILALYKLEGICSFDKLDGMYAFSIFDKQTNKVVMARDYFGEKPLFYRKSNNGFFWSSEIKSLIIDELGGRPALNSQALAEYFLYQFVPTPKTIYEGIQKLERNSLLIFDIETNSYVIEDIKRIGLDKSEGPMVAGLEETIKDLVVESILSRTQSEVGLSAFLSGGVDSGIVVSTLAELENIRTYTFRVDSKKFDESIVARNLAKYLNVENKTLELDEIVDFEDIYNAVNVHDQPFADPSLLPSYKLFEACSKTGQKVFLSGDGGDEMFIGYEKYNQIRYSNLYTSLVPKYVHSCVMKICKRVRLKDDRGIWNQIIKFIKSVDYDGFGYSKIVMQGYGIDEVEHLLDNSLVYNKKARMMKIRNIQEAVNYDLDMSLEGGLLPKVDMASMKWSIEVRAPFLNKIIYDYVRRINISKLIGFKANKQLLKRSFRSNFPRGYFNKKKRGFDFPISRLLNIESSKKFILNVSNKRRLKEQGLFSYEHVSELIDSFYKTGCNSRKLWTYFCFQIWYSKNFES